jgi:DNA mismatch repair protein MutL
MLESLLPVTGGREFVAKISGFVSAPRERRTTRDAQYFFVNNRFVRDKTIAGGLAEGFRSVLPHGVYPVAFLFVDVPLEEIDVNVHPAKTEIRFRRKEAVKDVIAEAIRQSLAKAGIVEETAPEQAGAQLQEREQPVGPLSDEAFRLAPEPQSQRLEFGAGVIDEVPVPIGIDLTVEDAGIGSGNINLAADFETAAQTRADNAEPEPDFSSVFIDTAAPIHGEIPTAETDEPSAVLPPVNSAAKVVKAAEVEQVASSKIRPIAQLHDSFIIAVDDEGLLLVDQHVAHERILFDKFRKKETDRQIESQNLLLPETFDLSPAQSMAFQLIEPELESLGFRVMKLSGRTVAIKSIPTDLPPSEARNLFSEILDTNEADKRGAPKSTLRDDIAASLACKAAVKINMKLTPEKMHWLIDNLLVTSSPTTCPHGRPVILRLTMKDIERGFHRT